MNKFAYAERKEEGYKLFLFEKHSPVNSFYDFSALMMSRLDFNVKFIEIPPIPEDEISNLLKYKLRSLYPGDPEETVFDYYVLNRKKRKHIVLFISTKYILKEYQKLSGGKPLFLPFTIIRPLTNRYVGKDCLFTFLNRYWIEIIVFKKSAFISSFVVKRENNIEEDFQKIKTLIPDSFNNYQVVFICSKQEKNLLKESSKDFFDLSSSYELVLIEDLLVNITKKTDFLFREKQKKNIIAKKALIPFLFILILFFVSLILNKNINYKDLYYNELNQNLKSLTSQSMEAIALKNEAEELEKEWEMFKNRTPTDVFLVLSELAVILGSETKISFFLLEKDTFQFEGIGPNPLSLMEEFKTNDNFHSIKLLQIVPVQGTNKERFKVSGVVKTE